MGIGVVGHVAALPLPAVGHQSRHWEVLSGTGACLQHRCRPDPQLLQLVKSCQEGQLAGQDVANAEACLSSPPGGCETFHGGCVVSAYSPPPIDKIILALGGKVVEELLDTLMTHHYTIVYASFWVLG